MADVTAIVLTLNEEKNIGECLRSVAGFCSRVVVIDSGSTDRTLEIAPAALIAASGALVAPIAKKPFCEG